MGDGERRAESSFQTGFRLRLRGASVQPRENSDFQTVLETCVIAKTSSARQRRAERRNEINRLYQTHFISSRKGEKTGREIEEGGTDGQMNGE